MKEKMLTLLVHRWLEEHGMRATTAKKWQRYEGAVSYWWNYFFIDGEWRGFNVYDDETVRLIV